MEKEHAMLEIMGETNREIIAAKSPGIFYKPDKKNVSSVGSQRDLKFEMNINQ